MSKGVQIALAVATALGGLMALLLFSAPDDGTFSYYKDVDSYLSAQQDPGARGQRVHGFVVAGSIDKDMAAGHVDFLISDRESERHLAVRYHGIDVPDLFRDGAEVVVEGRSTQSGFDAQRVLAKCPSKYEVKPGLTGPAAGEARGTRTSLAFGSLRASERRESRRSDTCAATA